MQHLVRGGRLGRRHDERVGGVGCGGCPYDAEAWVTANFTGGEATPVALAGEVTLQSGHDDDPYALPWDVMLRPTADAPTVVFGVLREDGVLRVSVDGQELELRRSGDAACPPGSSGLPSP